MKVALALVAALCVTACAAQVLSEQNYQMLFTAWTKQHAKQYSVDEVFARFNVFKSNVDLVNESNKANLSYKLAINQFADMSAAEFSAKYLGYKLIDNTYFRDLNLAVAQNSSDVAVPTEWEWNTQGAVTPVKDQGQCGSCWAFSATGALEGLVKISSGKLPTLSEQEMVDCATSFGNQGCNGGLMDYAFQYVIKNGLCTEASYPYKARDNKCQSAGCTKAINVGQVKAFKNIAQRDETSLLNAVYAQPVAVAIQASSSVFQFYSSGVLDSAACGTNLDHGVLATGFGTDSASGKQFYNVKNSWGGAWGDKGYIKMARGKNTCGIALASSYPTA